MISSASLVAASTAAGTGSEPVTEPLASTPAAVSRASDSLTACMASCSACSGVGFVVVVQASRSSPSATSSSASISRLCSASAGIRTCTVTSSSPCSVATRVTSCSASASSVSSRIVYTQRPFGAEDVRHPDLGQVEAYGALELLVGAGLRLAVRTPPAELRGVPEPGALHVVVGHLDDQLRPQRHPGQVLLGVPAADGARQPARRLRVGLGPRAPRVAGEVLDRVRRELVDQLGAGAIGNDAATPTCWSAPSSSYRPSSSEPTTPAGLVPAVAGDHAVGGALVLDLEHGPLVGLVGAVQRLGDDAVEAGALELLEPVLRGRRRRRCAGVR